MDFIFPILPFLGYRDTLSLKLASKVWSADISQFHLDGLYWDEFIYHKRALALLRDRNKRIIPLRDNKGVIIITRHKLKLYSKKLLYIYYTDKRFYYQTPVWRSKKDSRVDSSELFCYYLINNKTIPFLRTRYIQELLSEFPSVVLPPVKPNDFTESCLVFGATTICILCAWLVLYVVVGDPIKK